MYYAKHSKEGLKTLSAKCKDVLVRAIKTFVQAFLGVLIPAFVAYLQGGFPSDWGAVWVWLAPVLAAALAAAISAVWNAISLPADA